MYLPGNCRFLALHERQSGPGMFILSPPSRRLLPGGNSLLRASRRQEGADGLLKYPAFFLAGNVAGDLCHCYVNSCFLARGRAASEKIMSDFSLKERRPEMGHDPGGQPPARFGSSHPLSRLPGEVKKLTRFTPGRGRGIMKNSSSWLPSTAGLQVQ